MAADRTLMGWLQTALSMISFGFTIYKFLQVFQSEGISLADQRVKGFGFKAITAHLSGHLQQDFVPPRSKERYGSSFSQAN